MKEVDLQEAPKCNSSGTRKTVGSKENCRKRKFDEEFFAITGLLADAFAKKITPETKPFNVLRVVLEKVKEQRRLLCCPAKVIEFGIC